MKKWQIENSEISEILFLVFFIPSFRFCPIAKIENSDLKISEKTSEFSKFSTRSIIIVWILNWRCKLYFLPVQQNQNTKKIHFFHKCYCATRYILLCFHHVYLEVNEMLI